MKSENKNTEKIRISLVMLQNLIRVQFLSDIIYGQAQINRFASFFKKRALTKSIITFHRVNRFQREIACFKGLGWTYQIFKISHFRKFMTLESSPGFSSKISQKN